MSYGMEKRVGHTPQNGAVAIEFALVTLFAFLPLLLGIIEFGRYLYVNATIQEVTRRAAREQIVRWIDQTGSIQRNAVFRAGSSGTATLPAGQEITSTSVSISFYNTVSDALNDTNALSGGSSSYENFNRCLTYDPQCIKFVKATLTDQNGPVKYVPMIRIFSGIALFPGWNINLNVDLPGSTVIIPAESLGLPF